MLLGLSPFLALVYYVFHFLSLSVVTRAGFGRGTRLVDAVVEVHEIFFPWITIALLCGSAVVAPICLLRRRGAGETIRLEMSVLFLCFLVTFAVLMLDPLRQIWFR
jgi:hypothetical protein